MHSTIRGPAALQNGNAQYVTLPPTLPKFEYASFKAPYLVIDWQDLLARCQQLHVSANFLGMLTHEGEINDPKRFAEILKESAYAECAMLAFHRMGLYQDTLHVPAAVTVESAHVDLDDLLMASREIAMKTWDIDPVMDAPQSFVDDEEPIWECFCMTMEKQELEEPRSYHFT